MSCCDGDTGGASQNFNSWEIITGLNFIEQILIRDATQAKITNPDYDPNQPITVNNQPEVYPPLDLNGYTAKMDIRAGNTRDSDLIISLSDANTGLRLNDPSLGFITIFIDGADTGAEETGIGDYADKCVFFDLIIDPNVAGQKQRRILKGKITITESVTNV